MKIIINIIFIFIFVFINLILISHNHYKNKINNLNINHIDNLPNDLKPYRPLIVNVFNDILSFINFEPKIKSDNIIYLAELTTGINENKNDNDYKIFLNAFNKLCYDLENKSNLTPVGRLLTYQILHMYVSNRLKILNQNKNLLKNKQNIKIKEPVFVIGMPRSGTTFLHNLLKNDDKNFRAPLNWEIAIPPFEKPEDSFLVKLSLYIMKAQLYIFNNFLAPQVAAVHPVEPLNAEECMPILAMSMLSLQWNTLYNVTDYNDWLIEQDQHDAFKIHKMFLQTLQEPYDRNNNINQHKWLLKAPWHMNHLDVIFDMYPDANIIMPHRDPTNMLASLSSLQIRFWGIASNNLLLKEQGEYQLKQWTKIAKKYLNVRKNIVNIKQNNNILDLSFENELYKNPIETVEKIYKHFNWNFDDEIKNKMINWLKNDDILGKKNAKGKHNYKQEWFGLDTNESKIKIKNAFNIYCKTFNVECKF